MATAHTISSTFDSGNIRVVDCSSPNDIRLEIREEPYCPYDKKAHFQWFHFRVSGVRGTHLTLRILNAGKSSFPEAWPGYSACASYDYTEWFRVATSYEDGVLTITHTSQRDSIYFSYFAPYTYTRHQEVVASLQASFPQLVRLEVLGQSVQGRDLDLLRIGAPGEGRRIVWIIARQHPGESMSEWFTEGLMQRLVDPHDSLALHALQAAVFYVVPNMNPDGSMLGHLRTNAKGANLNREWGSPKLDYSPEVYHVLRKMEETGCDLFIDVHGDEEATYNFLAGQEGTPHYTEAEAAQQDVFTKALMSVSPDYRPINFYGVDPPGKADMNEANNAVGEKFSCLSITLEQPFKDVAGNPDVVHGWSHERSKRFGATCLHAIYQALASMGTRTGSGGAAVAGAGVGKRAAGEPAGPELEAKKAKGQ